MEHNIANRQSNIETQTVSMVIGGQHKQEPTKLTKVLIQYPSDWKRVKYFKDGEVRQVSIESANQFVDDGFGKIITEEQPTIEDDKKPELKQEGNKSKAKAKSTSK